MLIQKSGEPSIKSRVPSKGSISQYSSQDFRDEKGMLDDSSDSIGVLGVSFFKVFMINSFDSLSA